LRKGLPHVLPLPPSRLSRHEFRKRLNLAVLKLLEEFKEDAPDLHKRLKEVRSWEVFAEYRFLEPVLVEALLSAPKERTRIKVAQVLLGLGPPQEAQTIAAFVRAVADQDPEVRGAAEDALLRYALVGVGQAAPVLMRLLKDDDPQRRRAAAHAWRGMGLDLASGAVPELIKLLNDGDKEVRLEALATLTWLGPEAEAAVPALLDILQQDPEESTRIAALRALLRIDPEHRLIQPDLAAIPGAAPREVLLNMLRKVGVEARPLREQLQKGWRAGRGLQPPHPDGPEPPDKFWFRGEGFKIHPTPCKLLTCLWGQEKVPIKEAAPQVWETSDPTPDQVKSTLKSVNNTLLQAGVPWNYGQSSGFFVKK
jgi:HEAT repeat protein